MPKRVKSALIPFPKTPEQCGTNHQWRITQASQSMQYDKEGNETGWLHQKVYQCELCGKTIANHQAYPHQNVDEKEKVEHDRQYPGRSR